MHKAIQNNVNVIVVGMKISTMNIQQKLGLMNNFKYNLNYLIQKQDLSIKEFANEIGLSKFAIYNWFLDYCNPRPENGRKRESYFNVSCGDLFYKQLWKQNL